MLAGPLPGIYDPTGPGKLLFAFFAAGRISVRRLLEGLPGIGSVKAEQLRSELGISSRRRVQGLGPRQREALLQRFPADT